MIKVKKMFVAGDNAPFETFEAAKKYDISLQLAGLFQTQIKLGKPTGFIGITGENAPKFFSKLIVENIKDIRSLLSKIAIKKDNNAKIS